MQQIEQFNSVNLLHIARPVPTDSEAYRSSAEHKAVSVPRSDLQLTELQLYEEPGRG
jgi:hypothetical protein